MMTRSGERDAGLLAALRSECALIGDLAHVLRTQREAIAADDLVAIENSVRSSNELLSSLGEARTRRHALQQVPDHADAGVSAAKQALREAARALQAEAETSRFLLSEALMVSDEEVRALCGGADRREFYDQCAAPAPVGSGSEGALLRTRA